MKIENKFKVWDARTKRMSLPFTLFGEFLLVGGLWAWLSEGSANDARIDRLNDLTELQFIGLKDKNHNDIFQGDILKGFHWENKEEILIGEVHFMCGQWYLWDEFYLHECLESNRNPDTLYDFEIIGNVYQNRSLLPQKS